MFRSWSRSWEFAKLSYSTLLDHKHLIVFPIISTAATMLVLMSFVLPLELTGQLDTWLASMDSEAAATDDPTMYITAFLLLLPVIALGIVLGMSVSFPLAIAVSVPLGILAVLVSATADAIFKAYLYSFATGKTLPDNVDTYGMQDAFSGR